MCGKGFKSYINQDFSIRSRENPVPHLEEKNNVKTIKNMDSLHQPTIITTNNNSIINSNKYSSPEDEVTSNICNYAEKYQIKELLQEYMKRIILERPKEPVKFFLKQVTENPYTPPPSSI